ncbi:MAG: hypothetical protein ABSG36_16495 [Acidimicrobiales bacterium]|jgi:hypothetical protein
MQPSDTTMRRATRLWLHLAAVVSCATASLLFVAPAYGQKTVFSRHSSAKTRPAKNNVVTFGTQTSSAKEPDGRGIYLFGSTPGGRLEDHVAIINYSDQTATFLIRGTDAVNTPQGGFAALPINEPSHDLGAWIYLPRSDLRVTLRPRSDLIVPFLIEVPKDAMPGDHVGVITATLVSSVVSKSGQRLRLLQTIGTRIFLRVSGALHPALTVTVLAVSNQGTLDPIGTDKAKITYSVSNTGNVDLGGLQTVYVSGLFGSRSTAVHLPEIQLLLPGFSVKKTVEIGDIFPEIHETAHVSIRPLYIAGSVARLSSPFQGSGSFWAIPWTLIAIIIVAIVLVVVWFVRRRRVRRARAFTAGSQKPATGDGVGEQFTPGDVSISNGSSERKTAGQEPPAKDPMPTASD